MVYNIQRIDFICNNWKRKTNVMLSLSNLLKLLEGEYVEDENQQMFGFFK